MLGGPNRFTTENAAATPNGVNGGPEVGLRFWLELQRRDQALRCITVRVGSASLELLNPVGAQARSLGQRFLRQSGG